MTRLTPSFFRERVAWWEWTLCDVTEGTRGHHHTTLTRCWLCPLYVYVCEVSPVLSLMFACLFGVPDGDSFWFRPLQGGGAGEPTHRQPHSPEQPLHPGRSREQLLSLARISVWKKRRPQCLGFGREPRPLLMTG